MEMLEFERSEKQISDKGRDDHASSSIGFLHPGGSVDRTRLMARHAHAGDAWLIVNGKDGRCLDVTDPQPGNPGEVLQNGTLLELWDCWGEPMRCDEGGSEASVPLI
jgi:hypothetical protein